MQVTHRALLVFSHNLPTLSRQHRRFRSACGWKPVSQSRIRARKSL